MNGTAVTEVFHWSKSEWPSRESLTPGYRNILQPALVDRFTVILPPLHIRLGLMKQFVQARNKEGACFKNIQKKFPKLSVEKVKEGVFVGPQIRTLSKDPLFLATMTDVEKNAWLSFLEVVSKFLGNIKAPDYEKNCGKYADLFQGTWLPHELESSFSTFTFRFFSTKHGWYE